MTLRLGLALCALVLTFAACDSGEESDLAAASFTLQVDGGPLRTYAQAAYFNEATTEDGQTAFGVLLGGEGSPTAAFVRLGTTPAAGSYRVADTFEQEALDVSAFQGFYIDPDQLPDEPDFFDFTGFFYARSGSVTLDRVERGETVQGEYAITVQAIRVEGFDPEDPRGGTPTFEPTGEPVQLTGAFNASFDADLFGGVEIPDTPLARRRLAVPPGLIRLPDLSR